MCYIRNLVLFWHTRSFIFDRKPNNAVINLARDRHSSGAILSGEIGLNGVCGGLRSHPAEVVESIPVQRLDRIRRRGDDHTDNSDQIDP